MEPVGGMLDNLIKKYITDALKDASFDYKIFLGHPETKKAAQSLSIAAKASAKLPYEIDDKVIDYALAALMEVLDQYKNLGPVTVGSTADPAMMEAKRWHSKEDVQEALKKVGIDPLTITSLVILILQYAPDLIAMIKKLFGK